MTGIACKYCGASTTGTNRCVDCTTIVADMAERGEKLDAPAIKTESMRRRTNQLATQNAVTSCKLAAVASPSIAAASAILTRIRHGTSIFQAGRVATS